MIDNNFMTLSKNSKGNQEISYNSLELNKRIIWINGEITDETANTFIKKIIYLLYQDKEKPIKLLISTQGGSVEAGLTIYDTIISCPAPIYTIAIEKAYSMGAILLASGAKRFILPHSKVMIHQPLIKQCSGGTAKDLKTLVDSLTKSQDNLNSILSKHTGKTIKEIQKEIEFDHYFTADEAIHFNLVDNIIKVNDILEL